MEMDTFLDKLSNTLLQKLLNETEKINQKIDNLESKVEEQKINFGKTFSTLNNQVALILENTRKINKQISFQNEAKTEIKNVKIDLSSLKIDESPLDYINSHLEYKLVAQFGGPNGTIFIIAVKVNGKLYFGLDSSKKKARISAAENVFQDLKNQFNKISVNSENKEIENTVTNTEINLNVLSSNEKPLEYLKKNLLYSLVETVGPAHKPTFKMAVKVNGKIYHGFGNSKEKAKINTAENVFQTLKNQFNNISVNSKNKELEESTLANTEIDLNVLSSNEKPLEYLKRNLVYSLVETLGPEHQATFKMAVKVNGRMYYGFGNSKEKAKINTAENVFQTLRNQFNKILVNSKIEELESTIANIEINVNELNSNERPLEYLKRNLVYSLVETAGPAHQPTFKMAVKVNGKIYYGFGNSKEKAKINTTENVFLSLKKQFNNISVNPENKELEESPIANTEINLNVLSSNEKPLEYLKRNLVYSLVETVGPAHQPTFKMAVKVNGKMYYGLGNSKEKARINAAENVFQSLKKQFKDVSVMPNNDLVDIEISPNLLILKKHPLEYVRSVLKYSLVETVGPKNKPTFKMAVKVNGKVYFREDNTKTKARCSVAEEVFKDLVIKPYLDKTNSRQNQNQQKDDLVNELKSTEAVLESIGNNFPQPQKFLNQLYPNLVCYRVESQTDDEFEDEESDETVVEEKDIEIVMLQTNASRTRAIEALKKSGNNIINAIMNLTSR